jgi:hypothetical protein
MVLIEALCSLSDCPVSTFASKQAGGIASLVAGWNVSQH